MMNTAITLCVPLRKISAFLCGFIIFSSCYILLPIISFSQNIVFDISRNQPLFLHDDGYAGSSLFAKSLYERGYRISVNQLPLNEFLISNKPDLLVLTPTVFQSHSAEEVFFVRNYVQSGGKLLVFAEHENFFKSTENLNRFIEGSGIYILPDKAEQQNFSHFAEQFRPRAITELNNKDSVIFFFPATLQLKDSTYSKAKTTDGHHLAAIAPLGSGKIGVLTDFEIIWNMTYKTGFRFGQNDAFVLQMIESLIGKGTYAKQTSIDRKKNIWLNSNCFESDMTKMVSYKPVIDALQKANYGIKYSNMVAVEPTIDDIYIGLCACKGKSEMNSILKFKRLFLAGFNKSDFWGNITTAFELFRSKGYDTKMMESSLQSLWDYDGYKPISWEDSLEISLDMFFSRKISFTDSIHKSKSPISFYINNIVSPRDVALDANFQIPFNLLITDKPQPIFLQGKSSDQGVYYPAPFENNYMLTLASGNSTDYSIITYNENRVVSGASAIFRSDFPDKKFQEKVIKRLVDILTK